MPDNLLFTNILLIDDDEDDYYLFREALAEVAPQACLSWLQSTENLIEEVQAARPNLIVIDYKLPGENGIEGVTQLKAHPSCKNIPVIMWSTSGIISHIASAYKAGVHHYIEKPWNLKILAKKLTVILQRSRPCPVSSNSTFRPGASLQVAGSPEPVMQQ